MIFRMRLNLLAVAALLFLIACPIVSSAAIFRVSPTGDNTKDGSTWAFAKKTVQSAVDAAITGDEVWVAAGTYTERVNLKLGIQLYGGFAGNEDTRGARNPGANITILDGNAGGSVVTIPNSNGAAVDVTIIDGFTIRKGSANNGGGIFSPGAPVTIANNIITGNTTLYNGGGLYLVGSNISLSNNTISNNRVTYSGNGGGAWIQSSSITALNNTFSNNYCTSSGAGLFTTGGEGTIANNVFVGNSAGSPGGGLYAESGRQIINNTFVGNTAGSYGGGAYLHGGTFANNLVTYNSSGVYDGYSPTCKNNNVIYNLSGDWYSGNRVGSNGNISADPKLADAPHGNVHIQPDSPCKDAGDDTLALAEWKDMDGQDRANGDHVDIGADETDGATTWPASPFKVLHVSQSGADANDGLSWASAKKTVQAAVNAAGAGDEIWIAAGTYAEHVTLPRGCSLYGGFAGNENDKALRDPIVNPTILDGTNSGRVLCIPSSTVFSFVSLDGLTLTNGRCGDSGAGIYASCVALSVTNCSFANDTLSGGSGGAIYCSASVFSMDRSSITNCYSQNEGGAIWLGSPLASITNCTISNSSCPYSGGGLNFDGGSLTLTGNTFSGNRVHYSGSGGGAWIRASSTSVLNNTFSSNYCTSSGAGLFTTGGGGTITDNIFIGNSANSPGGGLYSESGRRIINNTFVGNTAGSYGGGVYLHGGTFANNLVAYNSTGVFDSYSPTCKNNNVVYNSSGDWYYSSRTGSNGNISADPKLADAPHGNIHIQPDSPCKDAGDDSAVDASWKDMDGQDRKSGDCVDIGADETDGVTIWPESPAKAIRVSPSGVDTNDGSSWVSAKKTVQAAVNAAGAGDEIWIAAGTYAEHVTLPRGCSLYGGFAGTEDNKSLRDPAANPTILDGTNSGRVLCIPSSTVFSFVSLDGLTLTNGRCSDSGAGIYASCVALSVTNCSFANDTLSGGSGGAISCSASTFSMDRSSITNCYSQNEGGAIWLRSPLASITNCTITNSSCPYSGGGLNFDGGSLTLTGNTFSGNRVHYSGSGGGAWIRASSTSVLNNTFSSNYCTSSGAGLFTTGGGGTIADNIFIGNSAGSPGGGLYSESGRQIINNTFVGNTASSYGGGAHITGGTFANNLVAYNSSGVFDSYNPTCKNNDVVYNSSGDWYYSNRTGSNGNISADPKLADAPHGNVHIQPDSLCKDAGDDTLALAEWKDMDGQDRVKGDHVDIGADETDGATTWPASPFKVLHVSQSGADANDGLSWASAKKTVQAAVNAAGAGDEIWIAAGTYAEHVTLPRGCSLYGGFAGNENDKALRDPIVNPTILDGTNSGRILAIPSSAVFSFVSVDGFTFTNGKCGDSGASISASCVALNVANCSFTNNTLTGGNGGAISCSASTFSLDRSSFTSCYSAGEGGAIWLRSPLATITNCTISNSSSPYVGGGLNFDGGSLILAGNTFSGSRVTYSGSGGGAWIRASSISALNNIFSNNYCTSSGAGMYSAGGGGGTIANNVFVSNSAGSPGGGLYSESGRLIINNTFVGNTSGSHGGGAYITGGTFANNLVAYNSTGVFDSYNPTCRNNNVYNNNNGSWYYNNRTGSDGNISADPMLRDQAAGDLHIQEGSSCINAGDNTLIQSDWKDFDGNDRVIGGAPDIGAYEFKPSDDHTPPDTMITDGPLAGATVCSQPVAFTWIGSDDKSLTPKLQYCYSVNGSMWSTWSAVKAVSLSSLSDGINTIQVKSRDEGNNEDPTPASVSFILDTTAPAISNIVPTPDQVQVTLAWTTDEPATSQVEYGADTNYGSLTPENTVLVRNHSLIIKGLQPNAVYHFRVRAKDNCGHESTSIDGAFTTLADTTPPTAVFISDPSQGGLVCSLPVDISWTGTDNFTPPTALLFSYRLSDGAWSDWSADTSAALTSLSDGSITVELRARDAAGNESASPASRTFTVDTSTPTISAVNAAPQIAQAVVTWTTSKPADSLVEYGLTIDYGTSTPINGNFVTSHTATLNGLAQGQTYHYRVRSKDHCGREVVSDDFTVNSLADTIAPDTQITSGPREGSTGCSADVKICWSGNDNFSQVSNLLYSWKIDDQDWSTFNADTCHQFDQLANGAHTFSIRAQDPAGNVDATPAVRRFTLDLDAAKITSVAANPSQLQAVIAWVTDKLATSEVEYGLTDSYGSSTPIDTKLVNAHNVTITGLNPDSLYHFRAKSKDSCGRETVSPDSTFTTSPDAAAPDTQIVSGPGEGTTVCGDTTYTFIGTDDTTPVVRLKYQWRIDSGPWSTATGAAYANLTSLTEGSHTFEVAALDAYNKLDPAPAIRHFTVRIQPPAISAVTTSPSQAQVTVSWVTDEPSTSQVSYGSTNGYGSITPPNAQLVTSHSITITGLSPNTTYHFSVRSKDNCGRESTSADDTFTTQVDDGTPETTISGGPNEGGINCTTTANITWTGQDNATPVDRLTYSWRIDNTTWSAYTGETSHVFTALAEGSHIFYVRAKDTSGNVDATPAVRHFTVDLTSPTISSITAVPQASQAAITWQTSKPSTSVVMYGKTNAYGSSSTLDQSLVAFHSVTITGLAPETTYHFIVKSKDSCDREVVSDDQIMTTTADTNVPNTMITSGPNEGGKSCSPDVRLCWSGLDESTAAAQLVYSFKMDSAEWSDWAADMCHQFTGLAEGLHTLSVKTKDAAGNIDLTPAVRNFKVDTTPPTASNVVTIPRQSSLTVSWITSEPATSQIEYGKTTEYGSKTDVDSNLVTSHKLTITGLTPETTYHLRVRSSDGCSEVVGDDQTVNTLKVIPPNLQPQSISPPLSTTSGQEIQLSWTVKNMDAGDAIGDWIDGFYLSEKDVLDETAIPLGQFVRPGGLSGLFTYTNTQNLKMPIVAPGLHYIILKVDDGNVMPESVEIDNVYAQAINFTMPKQIVVAPDQMAKALNVGVPYAGQLDISNMGTTPLTGITATVQGASANLSISFEPPSTVDALTAKKMNFSITASDESVMQNKPSVLIKSAEGVENSISLNLYVIPRQPQIVANPGSLEAGMIRGKQTTVNCEISNTGAVPANDLKVNLPNVAWMSIVSPASIGTLGPGEKTTISLLLKPDTSIPLGPYTGNFAVAGSNGGVSVSFKFNAISDQFGDLKVIAQDEFSYFADDHPNVTDATVTLTDAVDGHVVFQAMTDENGVVLKQGLPEGHYNLEVAAYKHATDKEPIEIIAGQVKEIKAFLHRQMVTYSWNVEPVQIEDKYKVNLEAVFETHVPAPVVTVDPPYQLVPVLEGLTTEVDYTITNHGLIAAQGVQLDFGDSDEFYIVPLIRDIGTLAPESSIVIPVLFRAKSDGPITNLPTVATNTAAAQAAEARTAMAANAVTDGEVKIQGENSGKCDLIIKGKVLYYYVCKGDVAVAVPIDTTPLKIGKEIYDIIKCGFDLAACAGGLASGGTATVGVAKCPDAVRCLFKYTCEIISANLGTPCCFCKMVSALLGDTGEMGDALGCLPKPSPGNSRPITGDGLNIGLNLPGNGFPVNITPWDFGQGVGGKCKPGFGPAPSAQSMGTAATQKQDDISKYGGKEVRYKFRCY